MAPYSFFYIVVSNRFSAIGPDTCTGIAIKPTGSVPKTKQDSYRSLMLWVGFYHGMV
jgi:hypothetical protein